MAEAVYILCTLTSIACAIMLLRGYFKSKTRLLLWSSLCFVGLALNNVHLFVDRVILPDVEIYTPARTLIAVVGLGLLLYGLVWDAE